MSIGKPRFEKMVNGTLVIRNASEEDDGKYLCTASNGVSDNGVSRQVQLTVHGMKRSVFKLWCGNLYLFWVQNTEVGRVLEKE